MSWRLFCLKSYAVTTITVRDYQPIKIRDHTHYSEGKVVPHGLYDIGLNKAHINLGTSKDTTEFACDSVANWWKKVGKHDHPLATQLLLMSDGGGSNPSNSLLFKNYLQ